jgi:hypothetical protein
MQTSMHESQMVHRHGANVLQKSSEFLLTHQLLLMCGIASSVLYVAMNVFIPIQWDSYDAASQTISELSAIDAPTRPLWVGLGFGYSLLLTAFGWGVWKSARSSRCLRTVAVVLIIDGLLSFGWPPMHQRPVLAAGGGTVTDTMHIVWSVATVVLMMLAVGFASLAFGKKFRLYSFATMAVLLSFGLLTGMDAPRVQANLPTPWLGVWERICVFADMLWVAVLAITLLRNTREDAQAQPSSGR